jgi:two-component system OmpR family response regulator/two-component system response regulator QseB
LILTARDAVHDRVKGLNLGADDYVIKPVDLEELAARLRALVRRSHGQTQDAIRIQDVALDPTARTVKRGEESIALSAREFDLLMTMMLSADRVLSREQLEKSVYSWGQEVESNTVEVYIHNLRKKLGPGLIHTVRGVGYLFQKEANA